MLTLKMALALCTLLIACLSIAARAEEPKLLQLSVFFRHGDRTAKLARDLFPNDPYLKSSFYPRSMALTNQGKRREYHLGEVLRNRYSSFLGPEYDENQVFAISSNSTRTIASLQLVLAALYPPSLDPSSQWHESLDWQPIPFINDPREQYRLFNYGSCEKHINETKRVKLLPEVKQKLDEIEPFLKKVGRIIRGNEKFNLFDALLLADNILVHKLSGLKLLPWMSEHYEKLVEASKLYESIVSYNEDLRRLVAGYMLRRATEDMVQAAGNNSPPAKKLSLYSAHDHNLLHLLRLLQVYDGEHPWYGSAVILELLSQGGNHYVKVVRYMGLPETFVELTLPGCETLCPLEKFLDLTKTKRLYDSELYCKISNKYAFQ